MPTETRNRTATALDQLNSFDWVRWRYLNGPEPTAVLDDKETHVRQMLKDGTFRGFGKLVKVPVFAGESQHWRTIRGHQNDAGAREGP